MKKAKRLASGKLRTRKWCQRSPQTGQPGSNQTSQSIFVSSHFHSKKLPVTLCYGAFWNENAYFVYANSVAGSIRPFVAGFQVTGDKNGKHRKETRLGSNHDLAVTPSSVCSEFRVHGVQGGLTTKMTDEEESATGARLEHAAARPPPHSVHRIVGCIHHWYCRYTFFKYFSPTPIGTKDGSRCEPSSPHSSLNKSHPSQRAWSACMKESIHSEISRRDWVARSVLFQKRRNIICRFEAGGSVKRRSSISDASRSTQADGPLVCNAANGIELIG